MFTQYRTEGVVLSKRDVREADVIFNIYTREFGSINVLGRSIRKNKSKLGMKMSLFSLVEIGFISGKNYNTLVDVETKESFISIKKNLAKLSYSYQLVETFSSLVVAEEEDDNIYSLLTKTLYLINKGNFSVDSLKLFYCLFSFRLLYFLGHKLYITNCALCSAKMTKEGYFNAEEGGVVCVGCFNEKSDYYRMQKNNVSYIYLEDVNSLQSFFNANIKNITNKENNIFIKILNDYLESIPRQKNIKINYIK